MVVRYRVDIEDAHAHLYRVTLSLPAPAALQRVSLPVWIVGSYMVRDFSRHLSGLLARQGRCEVAPEQLDKTTWQLRCKGRSALRLSYRVYAFDASVRGAFVDAERGFFNGSSLLLRAEGHTQQAHQLVIGTLPAAWQVATAMPALGPRRFVAQGYDELVDHPVELGRFWRGSFVAGEVRHAMVVSGALPSFDGERLLQDTQRLCEQHQRLWHGACHADVPFDSYLFLLHAAEEGHGGLEHRASTAIVMARRNLPRSRMQGLPEGYVKLLGLISHEYFHAWNVKRLRPADFEALDYSNENYTRLLWFFEGVTSYYDELLLLRAGLIDLDHYLRLLTRTLNAVAATPGRQVQSLAESSFDAWVKYYRIDENTPNASVSYYDKGALLALALDLSLRRDGGSLDEVLRRLWSRSGAGASTAGSTRAITGAITGATTGAITGAITEADIAQALQDVAGRSYAAELSAWVHGTAELPMAELLADLGVATSRERAGFAASLGLRLSEGPVSGVQVRSVLAGSAAAFAGVSAGDELLAVDGWRIRRLEDALAWIDAAQAFELLLVRDQRVLTLRLLPLPGSALGTTLALQLLPKPGRGEMARRRAWLDG